MTLQQKPKKTALVKVRKAAKPSAATESSSLPSERTWKLHDLAIRYHAKEQKAAKKK